MDLMHYLLKVFISYIFFMSLLFGNLISKDLVEKKWIKISPLREFSISGVAPFYNNFIIVHDNKKANQARVSMLDQKNNLTLLDWPELKLPFDLEAIHLIPGTKNEFLIMESRGYCYRISINSKTAIIEISEETGLPQKDLKVLKKLIPTHYHKKVDGKIIVKKTYWYLIEFVGDEKTQLIPDLNENITDCKWVSFDKLVLVLEESHEKNI